MAWAGGCLEKMVCRRRSGQCWVAASLFREIFGTIIGGKWLEADENEKQKKIRKIRKTKKKYKILKNKKKGVKAYDGKKNIKLKKQKKRGVCWCVCWDFFLSFSFRLGLLFVWVCFFFIGDICLGESGLWGMGGEKTWRENIKKNFKRLESLCNCSFTVISECSTRRNIVK